MPILQLCSVTWPLSRDEAEVDDVLKQTSVFLFEIIKLVSITTMIYTRDAAWSVSTETR